MARITRRGWLEAGLRVLVEDGPAALTVGHLCRQQGLTKGSFYHHFADFAAFKAALLAFFEQEGTLGIIEAVDQLPSPRARLYRLLEIVVASSATRESDAEVALRAWALQDAEVEAVQRRVDARRIGYVEALCTEITGDAARAGRMARLLYTVLVGCEQLHPPLRGEDVRLLFDEYLRLYGLTPSPDAP